MKLALPLIAALAVGVAAPALAQTIKAVPQQRTGSTVNPPAAGGALRADISLGCRLNKSSQAVVRNTTRYILPQGTRLVVRYNDDRRVVRLAEALYPGKVARFDAEAAPECRAIAQF